MNELAVRTCRWGALTVLQPYPYWLAAESRPWTCLRGGTPRPLEHTEEACRACPYWEPAVGDASSDARPA